MVGDRLSSKAILQKKYLTKKSVDQTFSTLQMTLPTLGLKNLKIKKLLVSSHLLFEYKEGFMKKGEIEINLLARQGKTEFSVNWSYPSDEAEQSSDENEIGGLEGLEIVTSLFSLLKSRNSSLNYSQLLEELRLKMNATEIIYHNNSNQSEKNIVVKIRCRACLSLYDEELAICPGCGVKGN
jgi:hypothetical protein